MEPWIEKISLPLAGDHQLWRRSALHRRRRLPAPGLVQEVRHLLQASSQRGNRRLGLRVPVVPGLRPGGRPLQLGHRLRLFQVDRPAIANERKTQRWKRDFCDERFLSSTLSFCETRFVKLVQNTKTLSMKIITIVNRRCNCCLTILLHTWWYLLRN